MPLRESFYHPHRMGECKIEYGVGRVDLLAQELDYLDKSRALVLYGPNAAKGQRSPEFAMHLVRTLRQSSASAASMFP